MSFDQSIRTCLQKYVTFNGRAQRSEYWWWTLAVILATAAASIIDASVFGAAGGIGIVYVIVALGTLLPSLAVAIRRLHDLDRSGWWFLLVLVPLIGPIVLIVFFVSKGTDGENRFGADPLG